MSSYYSSVVTDTTTFYLIWNYINQTVVMSVFKFLLMFSSVMLKDQISMKPSLIDFWMEKFCVENSVKRQLWNTKRECSFQSNGKTIWRSTEDIWFFNRCAPHCRSGIKGRENTIYHIFKHAIQWIEFWARFWRRTRKSEIRVDEKRDSFCLFNTVTSWTCGMWNMRCSFW